MPDDVGTSMDVEGAVKAAMAVTRENNFLTDIGTRWKLYFSQAATFRSPARVDSAKMDAFVSGIAKELDVSAGQRRSVHRERQDQSDRGRERAGGRPDRLAKQLSSLLVTLHSTTVEVPDRDQRARRQGRGQRRSPTAGRDHDQRPGHRHRRRQTVERHPGARSPRT